jgi:hypothetical protein
LNSTLAAEQVDLPNNVSFKTTKSSCRAQWHILAIAALACGQTQSILGALQEQLINDYLLGRGCIDLLAILIGNLIVLMFPYSFQDTVSSADLKQTEQAQPH